MDSTQLESVQYIVHVDDDHYRVIKVERTVVATKPYESWEGLVATVEHFESQDPRVEVVNYG